MVIGGGLGALNGENLEGIAEDALLMSGNPRLMALGASMLGTRNALQGINIVTNGGLSPLGFSENPDPRSTYWTSKGTDLGNWLFSKFNDPYDPNATHAVIPQQLQSTSTEPEYPEQYTQEQIQEEAPTDTVNVGTNNNVGTSNDSTPSTPTKTGTEISQVRTPVKTNVNTVVTKPVDPLEEWAKDDIANNGYRDYAEQQRQKYLASYADILSKAKQQQVQQQVQPQFTPYQYNSRWAPNSASVQNGLQDTILRANQGQWDRDRLAKALSIWDRNYAEQFMGGY